MAQLRRACGAMLIFAGIAAHAQTYPSKPLRIVTSEPGGVADLTARLIAQGLSSGFQQPAIVDNRGGASGVIGIEIVARAPADGYTLLLVDSSLPINVSFYKGAKYDAIKDFDPITDVADTPYMIVVAPNGAVIYAGFGSAGEVPGRE